MTIELTEAQARRAEAAYIVPSQSPVPADFVEKVHQMGGVGVAVRYGSPNFGTVRKFGS
jgi:hypothetical protein